jgi:hypothetical protein
MKNLGGTHLSMPIAWSFCILTGPMAPAKTLANRNSSTAGAGQIRTFRPTLSQRDVIMRNHVRIAKNNPSVCRCHLKDFSLLAIYRVIVVNAILQTPTPPPPLLSLSGSALIFRHHSSVLRYLRSTPSLRCKSIALIAAAAAQPE